MPHGHHGTEFRADGITLQDDFLYEDCFWRASGTTVYFYNWNGSRSGEWVGVSVSGDTMDYIMKGEGALGTYELRRVHPDDISPPRSP